MNTTQHEIRKITEMKETERKKVLARTRRKRRMNAKLNFFRVLCILLFIGLLARVGYIMIVKGEEYERKAIENQTQRQQVRAVNPNRGTIVDRNRQNLAISNIVYKVILDVRLIVSEDEKVIARNETRETKAVIASEKTFAALNKIMGLDINTLRGYIERNPDGSLKNDTNWLPIGIIGHAEAIEIKNDTDISCVFLFEESERSYVYGMLAPQVIGFTRGGAQWGIEKYYDSYLRGKEGFIYSYGYTGENAPENIEAENGNTIVTTLDFNIQQFAQDACNRMFTEYGAQNTSVIVMNPMTGEILAMAQAPIFDLNNYDDISYTTNPALKTNWLTYSDKEKGEAWDRIWGNYNTGSTFEPGSIFKPIVVAAALEEGIIKINDNASYFCSGGTAYPGLEKPIPCHVTKGHGHQTLEQVLANSCNVAMMQIGEEMLGRELFYKYQKDFGYSEKTGIDLPAEATAAALVYSLNDLSPVNLATSSFGQGFTCTPIQAITSFAALINGGNLLKPYVVSQVVDKNGNVVYENTPTVVRKVISRETSDYMRETLVKVVSEGTGHRAYIEGYNIGGKTGTGQQGKRSDEKYTVSFIAYLPAENPEILAMVLIDRPAEYIEGSTSAAPALREIMLEIIEHRGILPSDPTAAPYTKPSNDAKKLGNYIDMPITDAIASLNKLGIPYKISDAAGSRVTNQFPAEGSDVDADSIVLLYLSAEEGDTLVAVPDIVTMTLSQAKFIIENCGFVPVIEGDYTEYANNHMPETTGDEDAEETDNGDTASYLEPTVYSQMPDKGVQLPRGTQIIIKVE